MTTAGRIDRRGFLRGATFAALAGTAATAPACLLFGPGGSAQAGEGDLQELLRSVFSDPRRAGLVGRVFLEANPDEADLRKLLDGPVGRDWASARGHRSRAAVRAVLRARIRSDLVASRTTSVGGWILSITEARLCALACMAVSPTSEVA
jgi:hypothetical protein